ncbi:hypothetical protein OG21DRAFT_1523474 [Imleria badia]|nr:hypothetical protein OG21DRAFT_1523474 [Imleria badia]
MRQTHSLDTHPEFTVLYWPGFTKHRVEHWWLARERRVCSSSWFEFFTPPAHATTEYLLVFPPSASNSKPTAATPPSLQHTTSYRSAVEDVILHDEFRRWDAHAGVLVCVWVSAAANSAWRAMMHRGMVYLYAKSPSASLSHIQAGDGKSARPSELSPPRDSEPCLAGLFRMKSFLSFAARSRSASPWDWETSGGSIFDEFLPFYFRFFDRLLSPPSVRRGSTKSEFWRMLVGYEMMALGIIIKHVFEKVTRRKVQGHAGRVWTMVWILLGGNVIFDGYMRAVSSTPIDFVPPVRMFLDYLVTEFNNLFDRGRPEARVVSKKNELAGV